MALVCKFVEDVNLANRIDDSYEDCNFFCSERWDTFLQKAYNINRHFVGIFDGKQLIGYWPSYILKKGHLKIIGSPLRGWFTPWLGPRFFKEISFDDTVSLAQEVVKTFDEYVKQQKFDYVECSSLDFKDDTLKRLDYKPLQKATTILDISLPEDELLKSFSKTCRKRIKKAIKMGCVVRDISKMNFVPDLWKMTIDVFGRRGTGPAHNPDIIRKAIEAHLSSDHIFCLGVFKNGELICVGVHAWHNSYLVDLFRATYIRYYKYYPYYLLYWELFKLAKSKGCKYFDMMGIDPERPDQFKMSFHPQLVIWKHWAKALTLTAKAGVLVYEFYVNEIVRRINRFGS